MQIAILTLTSVSAVASVGCLLVMLKTANTVDDAIDKVNTEVNDVKKKVNRNAGIVKTALTNLEL